MTLCCMLLDAACRVCSSSAKLTCSSHVLTTEQSNSGTPTHLNSSPLCGWVICCSWRWAGFTSSRPLLRKLWGSPNIWIPRNPSPWLPSGADTHSSHHRHFVEDPCCNAHYYCSSSWLAVWAWPAFLKQTVSQWGSIGVILLCYDASAPHKIVSFIP